MVVKIVWYKPSDGQLPTIRQKYYVIDNDGEHRIMTYHPDPVRQYNWESESGSEFGWKTNDEIKKCTTLFKVGD